MNIKGLTVGHATHPTHPTGCTVFLCPPETVASVDVRGPAPGSREHALLQLDKPIQHIQAVVLTGGSALGLASASGVAQYLADNGIGHWTPIRPIPLVPAAVVYDLFLSQGQAIPSAEMGYEACQTAVAQPAQGNIGAGAGVTVGKWAGFPHMMKGGFGWHSAQEGDLIVSVGAVVNAIGDVVREDGSVLAGAYDDEGWLVRQNKWRFIDPSEFPMPPTVGTNTTLLVVATNAKMSKVEVNRLAQRAHDGMAIAIRPAHTIHDGDTAFALATGEIDAPYNLIANMAVEVTAQAIRNAVLHAPSLNGVRGLALIP